MPIGLCLLSLPHPVGFSVCDFKSPSGFNQIPSGKGDCGRTLGKDSFFFLLHSCIWLDHITVIYYMQY